jgi:hypothetical protein
MKIRPQRNEKNRRGGAHLNHPVDAAPHGTTAASPLQPASAWMCRDARRGEAPGDRAVEERRSHPLAPSTAASLLQPASAWMCTGRATRRGSRDRCGGGALVPSPCSKHRHRPLPSLRLLGTTGGERGGPWQGPELPRRRATRGSDDPYVHGADVPDLPTMAPIFFIDLHLGGGERGSSLGGGERGGAWCCPWSG